MYVFNHKGSKFKFNISYQYFILTVSRLLKTLELECGKLALKCSHFDWLLYERKYKRRRCYGNQFVTIAEYRNCGIIFYPEFVSVSIIRCTL